jgi:hypothetical protein
MTLLLIIAYTLTLLGLLIMLFKKLARSQLALQVICISVIKITTNLKPNQATYTLLLGVASCLDSQDVRI